MLLLIYRDIYPDPGPAIDLANTVRLTLAQEILINQY